jgi:hypothetical protein
MNIIRKRKSTVKDLLTKIDADKSTKMIDHQSEWNGGYNPTQDGNPLLPQGANPVAQSSQPKMHWPALDAISKPTVNPQNQEPKLCSCTSRDLFHFGCKCGGK